MVELYLETSDGEELEQTLGVPSIKNISRHSNAKPELAPPRYLHRNLRGGDFW